MGWGAVLPFLPRTLLSWLGLSFPTSPWDEPQVSLRGLKKSSSHKTSNILASGLALSSGGRLPSHHCSSKKRKNFFH